MMKDIALTTAILFMIFAFIGLLALIGSAVGQTNFLLGTIVVVMWVVVYSFVRTTDG